MKLDPYLIALTKVSLKSIKRLKHKTCNHKILEVKVETKLGHCPQQHFFFFDMTPKSETAKAKINAWDYIKLKSVCAAKEIINKMKSYMQNGRKYL